MPTGVVYLRHTVQQPAGCVCKYVNELRYDIIPSTTYNTSPLLHRVCLCRAVDRSMSATPASRALESLRSANWNLPLKCPMAEGRLSKHGPSGPFGDSIVSGGAGVCHPSPWCRPSLRTPYCTPYHIVQVELGSSGFHKASASVLPGPSPFPLLSRSRVS